MDWEAYSEKAKGNLKVAQLALDAQEYDAAAGRAYYSVFHAELAALRSPANLLPRPKPLSKRLR
jgi:uncharacterized protein (UPF0332 family)